MTVKELWRKTKAALFGRPPVNCMTNDTVRYIQQKVRDQTGFEVICMDTRMVNVRKNVGIVMPTDTPAATVAKAEDAFIAAAQAKGEKIERQQVLHYVPGSKSSVGRLVLPTPKTW